jgi:hypothetical protein
VAIQQTHENLLAYVELLKKHNFVAQHASQEFGISSSAGRRWRQTAIRQGLIEPFEGVVPDGFEVKSTTNLYDAQGELKQRSIKMGDPVGEVFKLPEGHSVKGISARVDGQNRVQGGWIKTDRKQIQLETDIETIKAKMSEIKPFDITIPAPTDTDDQTLAFYPLSDLHLGLLAWGREVGEDWDISIANKRYRDTMQRVAQGTPNSSKAVILGGGDLLHADNFKAISERSGHIYDVDGRWPKMVEAGIELLIFQIQLSLTKHDHVTVRVLRGNHDDKGAIAVAFALHYKFENDDRVKVDLDFDLFWFFQHGKTMLAATHGHECKLTGMPLKMANHEAEMWAATKYRYAHGFHIHHKTQYMWEDGGVIGETHQSPAAQDAWNFGMGFISGRSMCSITYHKDFGEYGRTPRVAA